MNIFVHVLNATCSLVFAGDGHYVLGTYVVLQETILVCSFRIRDLTI